jgi:hypothetical protein
MIKRWRCRRDDVNGENAEEMRGKILSSEVDGITRIKREM